MSRALGSGSLVALMNPRVVPFWNAFRFVALLGLGAAYLVFLALAVAPLFFTPRLSDWLTFALFAFGPIALVVVARRRRIVPTAQITAGYLATASVIVYLAVDESTLRHPVAAEVIAPAFPDAERSFNVLMRYGKDHPLGRDFQAPDRIFRSGPFVDAGKPDAWPEWLATHRAEVEADWSDLAPVRAWWDELNTFEHIADLTPARFDAKVMAFAPVRAYSRHSTAIAGLQALDGHGDGAFATLQPLLEVSRKLELSARTLVRFMIARTMQRMVLETADFVLERTPVSPAARARFAAALARGSGGEAGARRLVEIDNSIITTSLLALPGREIADLVEKPIWRREAWEYLPLQLLRLPSACIYNPRRTVNLLGDLNERLQELAARRETARMGPAQDAFFRTVGRLWFKNVLGAMLLRKFIPRLARATESYWRTEDLRTTLVGRLAAG